MLKDKPTIIAKNDLIEINHGRRIPTGKSHLLFIFLTVVFFASFFLPFSSLSISIQLVSIILFLFMYTATTGLIIEIGVKIKFYMSALGIKQGSWRKYKGFSCLVLKTSMKKRDNTLMNQYGHGVSVTEKFQSTELYLMDNSHRKKILCGSFDTYSEAKAFAKDVSLLIGYPIEKFSPKRIQRRS